MGGLINIFLLKRDFIVYFIGAVAPLKNRQYMHFLVQFPITCAFVTGNGSQWL